jgi:adenine C2-methylase RlmN of 23S rRNA A2503 and tRNA A37
MAFFQWLYCRGTTSFREMTDLSASLRDQLAGHFAPIDYGQIFSDRTSTDGTRCSVYSASGPPEDTPQKLQQIWAVHSGEFKGDHQHI